MDCKQRLIDVAKPDPELCKHVEDGLLIPTRAAHLEDQRIVPEAAKEVEEIPAVSLVILARPGKLQKERPEAFRLRQGRDAFFELQLIIRTRVTLMREPAKKLCGEPEAGIPGDPARPILRNPRLGSTVERRVDLDRVEMLSQERGLVEALRPRHRINHAFPIPVRPPGRPDADHNRTPPPSTIRLGRQEYGRAHQAKGGPTEKARRYNEAESEEERHANIHCSSQMDSARPTKPQSEPVPTGCHEK
jgi:hypothetical protein